MHIIRREEAVADAGRITVHPALVVATKQTVHIEFWKVGILLLLQQQILDDALLDADKELMNDFIRYAARNGVQPDYKDIARSRKLIEAQLRAYIGRNTPLNEAGFYVNIYPIDPVMLRAVEVLKTQNDHD